MVWYAFPEYNAYIIQQSLYTLEQGGEQEGEQEGSRFVLYIFSL